MTRGVLFSGRLDTRPSCVRFSWMTFLKWRLGMAAERTSFANALRQQTVGGCIEDICRIPAPCLKVFTALVSVYDPFVSPEKFGRQLAEAMAAVRDDGSRPPTRPGFPTA